MLINQLVVDLLKKNIQLLKKSLWKEMFWSQSYCRISTGGVTVDVIKQYIQTQGEKPNGK